MSKPAATFLAMTAWSRLYANYDDPTMDETYRAQLFPVVLMMFRWDGVWGFVGGFNDGLTPAATLAKEADEEIGFVLYDGTLAEPLMVHETTRNQVTLYHLHLGEQTAAQLKKLLAAAATADHAVVEGNAVWVHVADYGRGRGYAAFRDGARFATGVAEELDAVRAWLEQNAPPGAAPFSPSAQPAVANVMDAVAL